LLARHLGRHLEGHPTVVVENMPGAGGLVATRYLSSVAHPDGMTVGLLGYAPGGPDLDDTDISKLIPVGSPAPMAPVCAFSRTSGIVDLEAWRRAAPPPRIGATGPGAVSHTVPRVLHDALGLPLRLVDGFRGTAEIQLAMEAGDVDGLCTSADSVNVLWQPGSDTLVVLRAARESIDGFEDVPDAMDLAATDGARAMLERGIYAMNPLGRFYALPPHVPPERVAILRGGVERTLSDPDLLREAAQAGLKILPLSADEIRRAIDRATAVPPVLDAIGGPPGTL
jgi:tripartite-type tricarboxylate transporter receptor subunit TctC